MTKLLADYAKNAVTNINDFYPNNLTNEFIAGFNETVFNRFLTKQDYVRIIGAIGSDDLTSSIRNILESSEFNQQNQLQPVLSSKIGAVNRFMTWQDFMRKLGQQGVDVENYASWGAVTQFNWVPPIDLDKFINYRDYYWNTALHGVALPDYITIKNRVIDRELHLQIFLKAVSDVFLEGVSAIETTVGSNKVYVSGNVPTLYPTNSIVIVKHVDNTYKLCKILSAAFVPTYAKTELTVDFTFTQQAINVIKTTKPCTRDTMVADKLTIFGMDYTQLFTEDYVISVSSVGGVDVNLVKVLTAVYENDNTVLTLSDPIALTTTELSVAPMLQLADVETYYENGFAPLTTWDASTLSKLIWLTRTNKLESSSGISYRTQNTLTDMSVDFVASNVVVGDMIEIHISDTTLVNGTVTNVAVNEIEFSTDETAYIFSLVGLRYSVYSPNDTTAYMSLTVPLSAVTDDIWIDTTADMVKRYNGATWDVYVDNFSYLYDTVKNRKLNILDNAWSSVNSWVHSTQLQNITGNIRAQMPIIEFSDSLLLSTLSLTTHDWSYRDTADNSFYHVDAEPSVFELAFIQLTTPDAEFKLNSPTEIVFNSSYGNMTDMLVPGASITLNGFSDNNGVYEIASSSFEQYPTITGNNVTKIILTTPLNDILDTPAGSTIHPTLTSRGDAYAGPYINWRYDGINNAISTSRQPAKNTMYSYVVGNAPLIGDFETKWGYNWQSYTNVGQDTVDPAYFFQTPLQSLCLYDDYQEGDIRVYINKIRQYGNFIELESSIDDAYVGGIQFVGGVAIAIGDIVSIEVGEYASIDAGRKAVVVNTASGYELSNLSRYKSEEQIKSEANQLPDFIVVDSLTLEPSAISSKIFSYLEDSDRSLNPYLLKRLALSDRGSLEFTQHLTDDTGKFLAYKQISVDGYEYSTIWKVGSNFERYVPDKNSEDEWNIPNNWYYNAYHENKTQVAYTDIYNHFRSIIYSQKQPGLRLDTISSYFADTDINYGLGGTIKEHNGNLDLLMAATLVENVTPIDLINFAQLQYKNSLYKVQNIFIDNVASLFSLASTDANDFISDIASSVINTFELDSNYSYWFGDSSSYDADVDVDGDGVADGIGVKNWILTLPNMGIVTPVVPYIVTDSALGINELVHHDGHRSNVTLSPAEIFQLTTKILAVKPYASDTVTSDAQPYPAFIGASAVVTGDYLMRTNSVAQTRKLYRYNGTTWEYINVVDVLTKCLLEVETRLYDVAVRNYTQIYDTNSVKTNPKYTSKIAEQFAYFNASNDISNPMSNADLYSQNNPFTWNYFGTTPSPLPLLATVPATAPPTFTPAADWRQLYTNVYGTPYPHLEPWLVQGYSDKPSWWDAAYLVDGIYSIEMWDNIFAGTVPVTVPATAPPTITKLYSYLPVVTTLAPTLDGYTTGSLLPPYWNSINSPDSRVRSLFDPNIGDEINSPGSDFIFGQVGDTEYMWSVSMNYLYDALIVAYKLDPLNMISDTFGPVKYKIGCLELHEHTKNIEAASSTLFHGFNDENGEIYICNGLNQWYVNYNRHEGYDTSLSDFFNLWNSSELKLSYLFQSMIDSGTFSIFSRLFDITDKDYDVAIKRTVDYKLHKLDALNLTVMSMPSKYIGDVDTGWTIEIGTTPLVKSPINYFGVQNYNVDITGDTFVAMSYPIVAIDYSASRDKLALTSNNLLHLSDATGLVGTGYTCVVDIDGINYNIVVDAANALTIETLISAINSQLPTGYIDLVLGDLVLYSNSDVASLGLTDGISLPLFAAIPTITLAVGTIDTVATVFNKIININGNYTSKFIPGETFTIAASTLLDGTYTVLSTGYDYTNDVTKIQILENIALPSGTITVNGNATLDSSIGLPDEWETGTEIYFNTHGTLSGLNTERPYYIIRLYDTVGPESVLNTNSFKLAISAAKAETGYALSLSGVTCSSTLFAGKLQRTFKALGGAATKINWRIHAIDERISNFVYDGVTITGMQNMVDFLSGFSYYNTSNGFIVPTGTDAETGRTVSWDLYIEKLINWAFSLRSFRQETKSQYTVVARPSDDSFVFQDSGVPNWGAGTTVTLETVSGATLPPEFNASDIVSVPYYIVRTNSNTEIKLAITALDASKGRYVTFATPSTGTVIMQIFEKFENYPEFVFNPFRESITISQDVGLISNIFEDDNYVYSSTGGRLDVSQLFVSRRDAETGITLLGKVKDYNLANPTTPIEIGGLRLSTTTYEHILSFENYAIAGDLIYDPFLGLHTTRLYTEFNQQTKKTLRPTLGGYVLSGNDLVQNIESAVDDSRYYYDHIKPTEGKDATIRARKTLGYDGPKDYFTDIGLNEKTQFLFWQAMIQNKGTNFAIDAFANQTGLSGAIVDEFWAYKLAEYGGTYKREYPEMKLFASDSAKSELRIEFIPPNNKALNSTFVGVSLTDTARWWNQPDQLAIAAPYDTFYFNTKISNVYYNMQNSVQLIRDERIMTLPESSDAVIISQLVDGVPVVWIENTDYYFLSNKLIKIDPVVVIGVNDTLTVAVLTYDFDAQNPSKLIDKQAGIVVDEIAFWNPIIGQHYLKAIGSVGITAPSDPAYYNLIAGEPYDGVKNVWTSDKTDLIWMDTSSTGYLPYNDRSLMPNMNDRTFNWGKLADWASIELYQWTESMLSPSEWDAQATLQRNDYTIPEDRKVTGNVKRLIYKNTAALTFTPVWVLEEDEHEEFTAGLLSEDSLPSLLGTIEIYVNGRYAHTREVTDPTTYLSMQDTYPIGFYIHLVKRAHIPTQSEIDQSFYKYDTPCVTRTHTDTVSGKPQTVYYYWVANKTNKISTSNSQRTLVGTKTAILYNPDPYMILQGLRPTGSGYGMVFGNVFDEFGFELPYRYTQLIVKGLDGRVKDDNRYTLRFTQDFNLRDRLKDNDLSRKNVHEEWKLFREQQYNKVDRLLWNKLIESVIGYTMVSDSTYDATKPLPHANRVLYDKIYGAATRIGFGAGQVFVDGDVAISTIYATLNNPKNEIDITNLRMFTSSLDFTTPESGIASMNRIYSMLGARDVNKIFFEIIHDVMATKKEHAELFKTSWVALQVSQDVETGANGNDLVIHSLEAGTC